MTERKRCVRYLPPTSDEINQYIEAINTKTGLLFAEEEIRPDTEGVRIIDEEGRFLGWGVVGRYDWFYLKKKANGKQVNHFSLHHRNSSAKFNMTMVDQSINIETDEFNRIINEIIR